MPQDHQHMETQMLSWRVLSEVLFAAAAAVA